MSKYAKELSETYPDIKDLRRATRDFIKDGSKLALEKYYEETSLKRLKKYIREVE